MGRCYEFGVEIHAGCERTMVVAPEGGACECTDCGARCPGRFAGCAEVVATPGRIPMSAPAWARPGASIEVRAGPVAPPLPRRPAETVPRPHAEVPTIPVVLPPTEPVAYQAVATPNGNGHTGDALDMAPLHTALAELRQLVLSLAGRPPAAPIDTSDLLTAVHDLATRLLDRDERLARSFLAFGERQADLAAQVSRLADAVTALDKGIVPGSLRQILSRKT